MPDIKQKQRTPIKNINKKIVYAERIKDHAVNVKNRTNDFINQNEDYNPTDKATQNIVDTEKIAVAKAGDKLNEEGKKSVIKTKENFEKAKSNLNEIRVRQKAKKEETLLKNKVKNDSNNVSSNIIKKKDINGIKQKNAKIIKGADKTSKLTNKQIKNTKYVAKKAEQKTKEAIKLSKKAYQISKATAKKIAQDTRRLVKAIIKVVKASLIAAKAAFTLLIAGGWISVIVILIVCIMGGAMALYKANGERNSELGIYNEDAWNNDMVSVAISQLGNKGGQPYWSWYGFESRVEWCACFVSWVANECGKIDNGTMPKFAACNDGIAWFKQKEQWIEPTDIPITGDIIFFDWAKDGIDGSSDHVGIVEYYDIEKNIVHTIEGNSSDECRQREYSKDDNQIMGYGRPAF